MIDARELFEIWAEGLSLLRRDAIYAEDRALWEAIAEYVNAYLDKVVERSYIEIRKEDRKNIMASGQKFQFRLNKAPVGGGFASSKLPDGSYRVKIYKIFVKESENKKRNATDFVVVEFDVVQVLSGGSSRKDFKGNDMTAAPGDRRSWALDMSYANSPGNLNEFLAAAAGTDPQNPEALREANIDFDAAFEEALDEDNPLADTELIVDVVTKKTDGGRDYLAHRWSAVA